MKKKIIAIIQARAGSTRLPAKVVTNIIDDHPMLEYVIKRCQLSKRVHGVVLATTNLPGDDSVASVAEKLGVRVFRGSEDDVLDRYYQAALKFSADVVVRITGDCPLVDPVIIDQALELYTHEPSDYLFIEGYPRGLGDVEVLSFSALKKACSETNTGDTFYREHVMTYLTDNPEYFSLKFFMAPKQLRRTDFRLTVDEGADLELVRHVCKHFYPRFDFSCSEIVQFLDENPQLAVINAHVVQKTR